MHQGNHLRIHRQAVHIQPIGGKDLRIPHKGKPQIQKGQNRYHHYAFGWKHVPVFDISIHLFFHSSLSRCYIAYMQKQDRFYCSTGML
jgi:hypothetical protein